MSETGTTGGDYLKITFTITPSEPFQDLIIAELGQLNFESFEQSAEEIVGYVQKENFESQGLEFLKTLYDGVSVEWHVEDVPSQNWNEEWEKNFDPIRVGEKCIVRAPFHDPDPSIELDIVIYPKMSFGTGHHATTYQMIDAMTNMDFSGKTVLDMGSGTGVLAILAHMKGATEIDAIDIDQWSFENMPENFELNTISNIGCILGGAESIPPKSYDVILANINRNILLKDMPAYVSNLKAGGSILFSGFYVEDIPKIESRANELGLELKDSTSRDNWAMVVFEKR